MEDITIIFDGQLQQISRTELINILNSEHDDLTVIFDAEHRNEKSE